MTVMIEYCALENKSKTFTYQFKIEEDSRIIDIRNYMAGLLKTDPKLIGLEIKNKEKYDISEKNLLTDIELIEELTFLAYLKEDKNSESKKRYYSSLGLTPLKLSCISQKSTESDSKLYLIPKQTESEIAIEVIIESCRKNNLETVYQILNNMNQLKIDLLDTKSGWNCFHYCCYYGYEELILDLIYTRKCDYNYKTAEGWSGLHIASYKGKLKIVKILESLPKIDFNVVQNQIGTPLHCASKKNHYQIVSLLLLNGARYNIKDGQGYFPHELTNDNGIKKIFDKYIQYEKQVNYLNLNIPMSQFVEVPPISRGYLYKNCGLFGKMKLRYFEISPLQGYINRYYDMHHKNNNSLPPNETIPLIDIEYCRKIEGTKDFCFELKYKKKQVYQVKTQNHCDKWVERINQSIASYKFWIDLIQKDSKIAEFFYNKELPIENIDSLHDEQNKKLNLRRQVSLQTIDISKIKEFYAHEKVNLASFKIIEPLGSGAFGKVMKVKLISTGRIYAMKVVDKQFIINSNILQYILSECNVMKKLNHPYIIKLEYAFQTFNSLCMVMEYCSGGDLKNQIKNGIFDEKIAKFYIAELILAVEHLHKHDVIYRDLKPENILIGDDNHLRLTDFGLVKENMKDKDLTSTFCGSRAYLSPEMASTKIHGKSADIYGIGTVLYEMLTGLPPFYTKDRKVLIDRINKADLKFPKYLSDECKSLIQGLMKKNPQERLGAQCKEDIKKHPFFNGILWNELEKKNVQSPVDLVMKSKYFQKQKVNLEYKDRDYKENEVDSLKIPDFSFVREDN